MHVRQNAVTKEWVLFAPERARRPEDYHLARTGLTHEKPAHSPDCPFCPGKEDACTPDESLRYFDGQGNWVVRAFPNRYPAIVPEGTGERTGDRFHRHGSAFGHHEVIAESPLHNNTLALMKPTEIRLVLQAWRERIRALWQVPQTDHVVLFKNHGAQAGTSLEHPHSQVVSLPVAPIQVRYRAEESMRYYDDFGQCVQCKMLEVERAEGSRVVNSGRYFTCFVPYAAYSPYSLWLVPHEHQSCYSRATDDEIEDLADVLKDVLRRFYVGLSDPSYNLVMRLPSRDYLGVTSAHWYMAIVPRLGKAAGFEMGTGMFINTSLPEKDAAFLRDVPREAHP